jgi:hypothetical protein
MPRPAYPCTSYTRAALTRIRALIDQHDAAKAHTTALIAEVRARIATSWRLLHEIQRADVRLRYQCRFVFEPPTFGGMQ